MVTLLSDKTNTAICPILAALRLVLRARFFLQPDSMPVACYLKKDALAYISGSRIVQSKAQQVFPPRKIAKIRFHQKKSDMELAQSSYLSNAL
jgi:hypothetical protein